MYWQCRQQHTRVRNWWWITAIMDEWKRDRTICEIQFNENSARGLFWGPMIHNYGLYARTRARKNMQHNTICVRVCVCVVCVVCWVLAMALCNWQTMLILFPLPDITLSFATIACHWRWHEINGRRTRHTRIDDAELWHSSTHIWEKARVCVCVSWFGCIDQ